MASIPSQSTPYYTPEEYLTLERAAKFRSEYLRGEIVAMFGASLQHNRITLNIGTSLNVQLADRPCDAFTNDMRVRVEAPDTYYTYPDVVALCGEPRFDDVHQDTLLNPQVIVEVLSPSTEAYDKVTKFALYRRLESVQDYLLVAQDEIRVEHNTRRGVSSWLMTEYTRLEDRIELPSIGVTLALSDIYRKVEFPAS